MDGEGHPEGEEDVRDVEAGVKVGADAGGEWRVRVKARLGRVGGGEMVAKRRMPRAYTARRSARTARASGRRAAQSWMPKRCMEPAAIQYMSGGLSKKRMPSM